MHIEKVAGPCQFVAIIDTAVSTQEIGTREQHTYGQQQGICQLRKWNDFAWDRGDEDNHGKALTNELRELELRWKDVTAAAEDRADVSVWIDGCGMSRGKGHVGVIAAGRRQRNELISKNCITFRLKTVTR